MNGIKELIDICVRMSNGHGTSEEIECIADVAGEILSHIDEFIENYGSEWVGYPEECFYDNRGVMKGAVASFANILCEMECYVND